MKLQKVNVGLSLDGGGLSEAGTPETVIWIRFDLGGNELARNPIEHRCEWMGLDSGEWPRWVARSVLCMPSSQASQSASRAEFP